MVTVYTDGAASPNPGRGGYAAIVRADGLAGETVLFGGRVLTTNNRMELFAVIAALEDAVPTRSVVRVVSDSRYVVDGRRWAERWRARGWRTKTGKPAVNRDLWVRLLSACERHLSVEFVWTRGHADDVLNERCDALAARALQSAIKIDVGYVDGSVAKEEAMR